MSIINATPLLAAAGGDYQISRSVRLRSSASAYFNRTPASAGNRQVMTFSWWMKLGNTAGAIFGAPATTNPRMQVYYNGPSDGRFELYQSDGGGSQVCYTLTSARYRDPSAWYHFVIAIDTTQATAANRIKWYVNGAQLTAFDTAAYPAQNTNMEWNAAAIHNIGRHPNGGSYFDGYLTEVNFIDGQALTPSSFGETDSITGVWKPKKYAGTYGTNGFYLNFSDNSSNTATTIGKDYSGNGNNWTPNNISVTAGVTYDSMIDVPTLYADGGNGRGNYCVVNPLDRNSSASVLDGNLNVNTSAVNVGARASIGVNSGKWYWEVTVSAIGSTNVDIGVADSAWDRTYVGSASSSWGYFSSGQKYNNGSASAYGSSYTTGDTIGVAFDADAATLTFYKNGTTQGQAFTGVSGSNPLFPAVSGQTSSSLVCNFGQRPFAYTPPTGFKALNTQNLPEPTIKKGNQYFDVSTWTGDGSFPRNITNSGSMQPDFVWVKTRSLTRAHTLFDSVRGFGLGKELGSDQTLAEGGLSTSLYGAVTAATSNGFTAGAGSTNGDYVNKLNDTYVGWQWKESASAGFDIVTYTGTGAVATVGHGLGVAPAMVIVKRRDSATNGDWFTYHATLGNTNAIYLNLTSAAAASGGAWNNTSPTSSVFTVGTSTGVNANGSTYVAYLFAEVPGFSKFGSYTGNGSTDGPFVFTGFRPRYVMIKRTDSTSDWFVFDTARNTFNTMSSFLRPNWSDAEATNTNHSIDLLSNGFKSRAVDTGVNASGGTFIYAAFSEHPFKNSLAR